MDWVLLLLLGLLLFLARDVLLLATVSRGQGWAVAPAAYGLVLAAVFLGLGTAAESVSREGALALLRDPRVWVPAIAVHVALWGVCRQLKQSERQRRYGWVVALIPAPVFLYSAGGLCWLALEQTRLAGWQIGALAAAVLAATVGVAAGLLGRRWVRPAMNSQVLDFAGAANLSAILLLPLQQQSRESGLLAQSLDWAATLLTLGATAGLIALSFLFHRLWRSS